MNYVDLSGQQACYRGESVSIRRPIISIDTHYAMAPEMALTISNEFMI
jgi:hypothetical protein